MKLKNPLLFILWNFGHFLLNVNQEKACYLILSVLNHDKGGINFCKILKFSFIQLKKWYFPIFGIYNEAELEVLRVLSNIINLKNKIKLDIHVYKISEGWKYMYLKFKNKFTLWYQNSLWY
jgi:hypothetical protein